MAKRKMLPDKARRSGAVIDEGPYPEKKLAPDGTVLERASLCVPEGGGMRGPDGKPLKSGVCYVDGDDQGGDTVH